MGKEKQVLKPTIVTISSTALEALRKQIGRINLLASKAFCFKASIQLGALSALIVCHYHPICSSALVRPISFLSFQWLADCYFCAYHSFFCMNQSFLPSPPIHVHEKAWFLGTEKSASILALTLTDCVSLNQLTKLSEPRFPNL